jgi:hypothetical protein
MLAIPGTAGDEGAASEKSSEKWERAARADANLGRVALFTMVTANIAMDSDMASRDVKKSDRKDSEKRAEKRWLGERRALPIGRGARPRR